MNNQKKIAWGITGAGHFLKRSVDLLEGLENIDVFLSQAAKEVLSVYHLLERIKKTNHTVHFDINACASAVTKLYTGKYELVVIAPVTSNTIAKMAYGISDNLITNLFAHAGKCRIPSIILPCDTGSEIQSSTPKGEEVSLCVREIDKENIERLSKWEGVMVVYNPEQLQSRISQFLAR